MLKIITGGAMSNKDAILREGILASRKNNSKVLVIVPDQFSFEYDKMLYNIFGAKLFNSLSVYGIKRLSEDVQNTYGSRLGTIADDNTKLISMYESIKMLKSSGNVKYFQRNLDKLDFSNDMLRVVAELRQNDILPTDLENVSQKLDGVLSEKLFDISLILNFYNEILDKKGYKDRLSYMINSSVAAKESRCFKGFDIFIDRFESFTYDELKFIEAMLSTSNNMTVALTLSNENNSKSNTTPFLPTIQTKSDFESMARGIGQKIQYERASEYYYNKKALTHVNANIFCLKNNKCDENDGVKVVYAKDFYEEVEYTAAEIKRLIREENLNYNDIAVISRQLSDYAPIIEGAFERYEIPTFIDKSDNISKSVLAIYISSILDCVRGKTFKTEKLLRMIKSPLSPFKDFEVSTIEEYCYSWNVDGDMWKTPFTATDVKRDNLETVNNVRERIVSAISEFRNRTQNSTSENMVNEFINLINKLEITSCANALVKISEDLGDSSEKYITENSVEMELIREFKQIWSMFVGGLRSIYDNLGEREMSVKEFTDIFELIMSGMTVSNPPQRINTVTVASAEHSRLSAVKAVFVLGANVDRMPAAVSKTGIFTEKEKQLLKENELTWTADLINQIHNERLITYLALTQGSHYLYVCCPRADIEGKALIPSTVVKELIRMFGEDIIEDAEHKDLSFYCQTPRSAFNKFSECMNDNTTEAITLKRALEEDKGYKEKVESLIKNSKQIDFSISQNTSAKLFFNEYGDKMEISISPSSLENYTKCPFMYFCKYGLGLHKPVKNEMNGINRGVMIHSVLEKIISKEQDGKRVYNPEFETMDIEEIKVKTEEIFQHHLETEMGGGFGKTDRFYAMLNRLKENAFIVVSNIQQELINSKFKPQAFELKMINDEGKGIFKLETGDIIINIKGTVDRVDIFTDEKGDKYIKIVDYKTGSRLSLLSNMYNGLSLQLLMYLIALIEGEHEIDGDENEKEKLIPAGIVYTPARYINSQSEDIEYINNEEKYIEASIEVGKKTILKTLARYGLIINDSEVMSSMNEDIKSSKFIPDKDDRVNSNMLKALSVYAKLKLENTAENLLAGKINADPLSEIESGFKKPCRYCDFDSICGVKTKRPKRIIDKKEDKESLISILGKISKSDKDIEEKGGINDDK
ncbi:MAG: hypothetical protein GX896_03270 [Clostridiales bacterium]|nr:hypothetical protein [Clostridiales bacterium]